MFEIRKIPNHALCLIAIFSIFYAVLIFFNYDNAWMHQENTENLRQTACRIGARFTLEDFRQGLNFRDYEEDEPRFTRPLSSLFELFNSKIRLYLWQYIPPHPSFSLVWIFSFILSPVLFFFICRNFGMSETVSYLIVLIYHSSIGLLGPLIMLFHPAKPFTSFWIVAVFYLLSRLKTKEVKAAGAENYLISVFLFLFVGFFWDETAVFIYPFSLLFFWKEISRHKSRKLYGIIAALPFAYGITIRFLIPNIGTLLNWHDAVQNIIQYRNFPFLSALIVPDVRLLKNIYYLFNDHFFFDVPFYANLFWIKILASIACFISVLTTLAGLGILKIKKDLKPTQNSRNLAWVATASLFIFAWLHNFQLSSNVSGKLWGIWWYGSLFSFFFSLFFGIMLTLLENKMDKRYFALWLTFAILSIVPMNLIQTTYRNRIFLIENKNIDYSQGRLPRPRAINIFSHSVNPFDYFSFTESWEHNLTNFKATLHLWHGGYYNPPDERKFTQIKNDPLYYLTQDLRLLEPPRIEGTCDSVGPWFF